jgi:hypothetical protein
MMKTMILACALALSSPLARGLESPAQDKTPPKAAESIWAFLVEKYDTNGDGTITKKEYGKDKEHWERLDIDGDGKLTEAEVEGRKNPNLRGKKAKARKVPKAPKEGSRAPGFELEVVVDVTKLGHDEAPEDTGDKAKPKKPETVSLGSFRGKKPVALIFGSYT